MLAIYILGVFVSAGICYLLLKDHYEQGCDIKIDDALISALLVVFSWIGVMVFVFAYLETNSSVVILKSPHKKEK